MRLLLLATALPLAFAGCTGTRSADSSGVIAPTATVPARPRPGTGCGPNGIIVGDKCRRKDLTD